jgi:hypothetical protein
MLTTTVNGNLQAYWYTDGYLRTACREYNTKNVTSKLVHLTNDAIQKRSEDYGKFESGNKVRIMTVKLITVFSVKALLRRILKILGY